MCKASNYLSELESITKKIQSDLHKLNNKQSEYDKKLSDVYHRMETTKFNACEGYYLAKELQEILRKRRLIKHELGRLKCISDTLALTSKVTKAKNLVQKTLRGNNDYTKNFGFTFSDIEEEVLH